MHWTDVWCDSSLVLQASTGSAIQGYSGSFYVEYKKISSTIIWLKTPGSHRATFYVDTHLGLGETWD